MKQLERIYVTEKQFWHKQSQKGAKFTHKINKIAIMIRHFTRAPWRTDIHNEALYKEEEEEEYLFP